MHGMRNLRSGGIVTGLALVVTVGTAVAQEQRRGFELPTVSERTLAAVGDLGSMAISLYPDATLWHDAARLHRESAEALPAFDPRAFVALDRAARLYEYAGRTAEARRTMEEAARIALAVGDDCHAAGALLDAAILAAREGYPARRRELLSEARLLIQQGRMLDTDRSGLRARLLGPDPVPVPVPVAVVNGTDAGFGDRQTRNGKMGSGIAP